ncbi:DUF7139 domain-containing protein [Halorussus litoreus]|uniref:DUF7139 domain-containing protein n=1 Tax=Halorussus litoreus TaxID=1710536 RepID=UPI000E23763E|nr:hypothetical protein [Halorussus litoreus]
MTSLAEAYEENVGEVGNVRLLYLGLGLFAAGALLVVLAILFATTGLRELFGLHQLAARQVAGVLAGLGVPAVFVGIFSVLPASQRVRAAAAIGAGISVLGVALFTYAYPRHWAGYNRQLTLPVVAVYFVGVLITFGCLFVAVVNFKTRNDPGGTVTLQVDRGGEVETVEVDREDLADAEALSELGALESTDGGEQTVGLRASSDASSDGGTDAPKTGLGGVAFMGQTPDGELPTQTNQSQQAGRGPTTSDGGTATGDDIRSPLDDAAGSAAGPDTQRATDTYCGNCKQFRYVRTNDGMVPYCGYYDRTMEDMDACEQWEPNN